MTTLILIAFAVYFISIFAFFFWDMAIMKAQKNREIEECQKSVKGSEEDRRDCADSLRRVALKHTNMKREIKKLIKEEDYPGPLVGKANFIKALKGVINGE